MGTVRPPGSRATPGVAPVMALVVACLFMSYPGTALCWDCEDKTPEDHFVAADYVFEGTVEEKRYVPRDGVKDVIAVFRVKKRYKGDAGERIEIRTGIFPISPGYPFVCKGAYMVYAYKKPDGVRTDRCTPTRPSSRSTPTPDKLEELLYDEKSPLTERQKDQLLRKMECR